MTVTWWYLTVSWWHSVFWQITVQDLSLSASDAIWQHRQLVTIHSEAASVCEWHYNCMVRGETDSATPFSLCTVHNCKWSHSKSISDQLHDQLSKTSADLVMTDCTGYKLTDNSMATERGVVFQYANDCSLTVTVKHTRCSACAYSWIHTVLYTVLMTVWCGMGQPDLLCTALSAFDEWYQTLNVVQR